MYFNWFWWLITSAFKYKNNSDRSGLFFLGPKLNFALQSGLDLKPNPDYKINSNIFAAKFRQKHNCVVTGNYTERNQL